MRRYCIVFKILTTPKGQNTIFRNRMRDNCTVILSFFFFFSIVPLVPLVSVLPIVMLFWECNEKEFPEAATRKNSRKRCDGKEFPEAVSCQFHQLTIRRKLSLLPYRRSEKRKSDFYFGQ